MITVVDASAIVAALVSSESGGREMREHIRSQAVLAAPQVIDLEVASVLRRLEQDLGPQRASQAIGDFRATGLNRYPHRPLVDRIWALRDNLTPYDAAYVALAEALDAPLLTLDAGLARTPGHRATIELLG